MLVSYILRQIDHKLSYIHVAQFTFKIYPAKLLLLLPPRDPHLKTPLAIAHKYQHEIYLALKSLVV